MNSALSWSVKGIDPEVREAAKVAARKSGKTLGQWLNSMILDLADQPEGAVEEEFTVPGRYTPRRANNAYEDRIEFLEHQLASLSRQQTDTAIPRRYGSGAGAELDSTPLQHVLERLDQTDRDTVRTFEAVEERLNQISQDLNQTKFAAEERPDPDASAAERKAFEKALQNVVDHIETADKENREVLSDMRSRLDELGQKVTATSNQADEASTQVLRDVELQLTSLAERVDQIGPALTAELPQEVENRLSELAHRIEITEQISTQTQTALSESLEQRLNKITERLEAVGDTSERTAEQVAAAALQTTQAAVETTQEDFREIETKVQELAAQIVASSDKEPEIDVAISDLMQRMSEMSEDVEQVKTQAATGHEVQSLRTTLDSLTQSIEQQFSETAQDQAFNALEERLAEVSQRLEQTLASPQPDPQVESLEHRIQELDARLETMLASPQSDPQVESLRTDIQEISSRVEAALAAPQSDPQVETLKQEIQGISAKLESSLATPPQDPQVENLERRIHEIDARLAAAQGENKQEEMIKALSAQIESLSQRVSVGEQQQSGIQAIEKSIAQLFESVEQTRSFASQEAEKVASRMFDQFKSDDGGDDSSATLHALEQGMQAIKASAENADKKNQETLEAVHDTLEKVITRLVALEDAPAPAAEAPSAPAPGAAKVSDLKLPPIPPLPSPQGFTAPGVTGTGDQAEPASEPSWKAAVEAKSAEQMEELLETGHDEEPEDEADETDVSADDDIPDLGPVNTDPVSRRNDFIAAARQAAQAASQGPAEDTEGASPFKALRKTRRNRQAKQGASKRRPLILAAIVLLMIGAASAYTVIGGKRTAEEAKVPSPIIDQSIPASDQAPAPVETPETPETPVPVTTDPAVDKQSNAEPPPVQASEEPLITPVADLSIPVAGPGKQALDEPPTPAATPADPIRTPTARATQPSDDLTTGNVERTQKADPEKATAPRDTYLFALPGINQTPNTTAKADPPKPKTPEAPTSTRTAATQQVTQETPTINALSVSPVTPAATTPVSRDPGPNLKDLPPPEIGPKGLRMAAASGDPVAQFMVANAFTEGKVVKQDFRQAALWYQKAAGRGLAPAQYRLATFYEKGKGVPEDLAAARIWYSRAAEKGNRKAMHNLAVIYADGSRGTPDFSKAGIWFRNAAELGLKDSQYNLGILHERGLGVAKDLSQAYKWFALAAKQGDTDAANRMRKVENRMAPQALIQAKLEVQNWTAKATDKTANVVTAPAHNWRNYAANVPASAYETRELVSEAQALLSRLGYSPGAADGLMGNRTRDAIRLFQKANNLAETGAVTQTLIQALRQKAG